MEIPPREQALLELFLEAPGRVFSLAEIERAVWPRQQVSYASSTRLIHTLRRFLGAERIQGAPTYSYNHEAESGEEWAVPLPW